MRQLAATGYRGRVRGRGRPLASFGRGERPQRGREVFGSNRCGVIVWGRFRG